MAKRGKVPFAGAQTDRNKQPRTASQEPAYTERKAAWRVGKIQLVAPYGWHELDIAGVVYIRGKLANFEKNTWRELFVRDARWNHRISADELKCAIARKWMADNMPDQPYLWTLRFSATERVWGILSEDAYMPIFWDPDHLIWDVPKK